MDRNSRRLSPAIDADTLKYCQNCFQTEAVASYLPLVNLPNFKITYTWVLMCVRVSFNILLLLLLFIFKLKKKIIT